MTKIEAITEASSSPGPSGITVIIVGLGISGLAAAIECHRRGHAVIGFEKKPDTNQFGDLLGISGNGARVLERWNNRPILDMFGDDDVCRVSTMNICDEAGNLLHAIPYDPHDPVQGNVVRRSGLLDMLYREAFSLGLDLRFGVRVEEYWEADSGAGVVVRGERIRGDCVIASDGVHSKARRFITDQDITLVEGGVAYRSIFRKEDIAGPPDAQMLLSKSQGQDFWTTYIGNNTMVAIGTAGKGEYVVWTCVARGRVSVDSEAWMQPATVSPALEYIADWPARDRIAPILLGTPPQSCFNHTLLTAEPLKRWVSSSGRMILIGDAAHPLLPTLGQGANQGIEDAAVVAICLELCGKNNIPLALRATEKLRHPRASLIQKLAIEISNNFMESGGGGGAFKGQGISQEPWIFNHDCIRHAYEEFPKAAMSVTHGTPYTPTNIPILCHDTSGSR
ncbi:hypothetical protein BDV24DRAFT_158891 [Aspergillus arachidicola]|uniref:FAD-binding domain-containing protein n=1 Tax=Aspergillus arachidicola TaxID=656916 RepID=A0A2G7FTR1_9EURO|nr:hypothetical protein BDV24DRAFT_158891 [Aspergillus arachidicola]PIG84018.1 hypothetical protein AARAC_006323 [Aspergillus arachidicola]